MSPPCPGRKEFVAVRWRTKLLRGHKAMATQPPARPATAPATAATLNELRIISHSNLFYWWPVWAFGFVLGIVSLVSGYELAAVPHGTIVAKTLESDEANPGKWDPEKKEIKFDETT